jgi:class 3 adenylate cyclase/tetratricopeptide (TPR) repeat protein
MSSSPVTLLFTDLLNATELLQRGGDEQSQRIFRAHHRLLKRYAATHGGQEVKWLGDGLMTVFASPMDAVRCAVAMQQEARRRAAGERLAIRVGLNVGDALRDESDYFGTPVVVARGLCAHALAGQILCSTLVPSLLTGQQIVTFRDCGLLPLKGVAVPASTCEVLYQQDQPTALLTHPPFVGRAVELARLTARLRDVRAGIGGLVMLVGEPGIGKTRTLEECAETARNDGAVVLWGRCYEGEATRPYGPFVEALTDHARTATADALRADLGFGAAPLARLVPAVRERLIDVPEPVALQPDEERMRLLDAMAQLLIVLSSRAPVVLVLDDLQWADAATVAMLRHVARFAARNRVLLLGAYRDADVTPPQPLADALGALPRETNYEQVTLVGLDRTEVEQLLEAVADQTVSAAFVAAITAETSGNPFFIREVLLHLVEEQKIVHHEGHWTSSLTVDHLGIPQGVRQVIQRRLARLSEAAKSLLRAAAGFSGSFRLDLAAGVAGLQEADALDALDEGLAAQLLRATSDAESFDFTHALVRHTLYAELISSRQVRLHRQIAETIEQVCGDRAVDHAGEIARHYHQSASLPGAECGVAYSLVAAQRAEEGAAFAEAAEYLHIALALCDRADPRRPRVLARLALALTWNLALDEAEKTAIEAAAEVAAAESNDAAADFLADAADAMWVATSTRRAWSLAAGGLKYLSGRRDMTWARLMVYDIQRREAADPELPGIPIDSPERQEVVAHLWQLPFRHPAQQMMFAYTGFSSKEDALARAGNDPIALLFWAGEYRKALPLLEQATATALQRGQIALAAFHLTLTARAHATLGDLASFTSSYGRAVEISHRVPDVPWLRVFMMAARGHQIALTGEGWELMLASWEAMAHDGSAEVQWAAAASRCAAAWAAAHLERSDDALRWLESVMPAIERAPGSTLFYPLFLSLAVTTLEELGRTDHVEILERNLRTKWLQPDFRFVMTDARMSLAELCGLQGRFDEAAEWFAKARAVLDAEGSLPMRARTDFYEARMYLRRDAPGDRARAATLLHAALEQFRTIGMTGWAPRAEEMLAAIADSKPVMAAEIGRGEEGTSPAPLDGTFRRQGPIWTITYRGQTFGLPHVRGLAHLQQLVLQPGRELHVRTLDALDAEASSDASVSAASRNDLRGTAGMPVVAGLGDAGELLDEPARRAYRKRLVEAQAELDDAEQCHDLGRATRLRAELEAVEHELRAAVGLGGRPRRAGADVDRRRVAVTKCIRAAILQIADVCPALADHLTASVRTGVHCVYDPRQDQSVEWIA